MKITQPKKSQFQIKTDSINLQLIDGVIKIERKEEKTVEFSGPGEYEINGVWIFAFGTKQTNYLIHTEGLEVGFFPGFEEKLSKENIEEFGDLNIAIVEPENDDALQELTAQLQPQAVIVYGKLAKDVEEAKEKDELKIKSSASLPQETQIYLLGAS